MVDCMCNVGRLLYERPNHFIYHCLNWFHKCHFLFPTQASHNIGFAFDTQAGLMVPNVKNVQALAVYEVASEINRLIALGLAGKLGSDDLSGGTFSLSNIGTVSWHN